MDARPANNSTTEHTSSAPDLRTLPVSKIAQLHGVDRYTVYRWVQRGLPVIRISNTNILIRVDTVTAWLSQHESTEVAS